MCRSFQVIMIKLGVKPCSGEYDGVFMCKMGDVRCFQPILSKCMWKFGFSERVLLTVGAAQ